VARRHAHHAPHQPPCRVNARPSARTSFAANAQSSPATYVTAPSAPASCQRHADRCGRSTSTLVQNETVRACLSPQRCRREMR
jgi:hypothetical protein